MPSRRQAMGTMLAAGGMAVAPRRVGAAPVDAATMVSTWDFGAAANAAGIARLRAGGSLLDAVEAAGKVAEADPANHSVGYSGYPDRDGRVTLDAVIMDDAGNSGAVAALEDTTHAISVARAVMEHTPHVMLVGEGATRFARDRGFLATRLLTPESEAAWREWLKTAAYHPQANIENQGLPGRPGDARNHDTIGILARDERGRMAGGCTTSGMAFKMHGRVGDSPIVGAGLYVERAVGGATATGVGEEVVRIAGAARVVAGMRAGLAPMAACEEAVRHIANLRGDAIRGVQVGFLALDHRGRVGAFCLLPGFTYAVSDANGSTRVLKASSLFGA
ncbi:N(4)-(beta-N-acetylglucosaminyl)-L-asparaginase [Sphingomonas sp. KR1UV-12]|uniref:N(4)-(Beta-N-acetylglucosaminyl)-L-asparaginase n=1 Tax=Sphingomonas aurea TaxID=3063994 RepID=A0ABT9ELX4_9SPHN|nr:N(4)-(beta-N-acetylglucosaminyl)-L-asparaginase [Sphingomonas sp. KR1UV-12]MDP1027638.1 N(4)-(beta-N-acetylglucosaminyl)-L-asparaginase [Sphingomonas sp. KR1UV-12]